MQLHVPMPLPLALFAAAAGAYCAWRHHARARTDGAFVASSALAYFNLAGSVGVLLWAALFAGGDVWRQQLLLALAMLPLFIAVLGFRYRVIVDESALTVVLLRRRAVPWSEIVDWEIPADQSAPPLLVYLRNGETLRFSSLLPRRRELARIVSSRVSTDANFGHDSPEKLRGHVARARQARRSRWIIYALLGCVIVAIYLSILR